MRRLLHRLTPPTRRDRARRLHPSVAPKPAPADGRGGVPPGYPLDVDVVAPLVITTISPDPIPVTGTDGKVHVAYELSVLNSGPRPATITKIETLADGP